MDTIGIIRRFGGLAGLVLVYLGYSDEEAANAAVANIEMIIGSVLFLADFGKSVFGKIKG